MVKLLVISRSADIPRSISAADDESVIADSQLSACSPASSVPNIAECNSLRSYLKNVRAVAEKEAITQTLEKTHWNRKAAARLLNVSYRLILYKIEEYHLSPPDYGHGSGLPPAYIAGTARH